MGCILGVPLRVGLSATSPATHLAARFGLSAAIPHAVQYSDKKM